MAETAVRMLIRVIDLCRGARAWCELLDGVACELDANTIRVDSRTGPMSVILHDNDDLPDAVPVISKCVSNAKPIDKVKIASLGVVSIFLGDAGLFATIETIPEAGGSHGGGLFGTVREKRKPVAGKLIELYAEIGRTADDLPYTAQFEQLVESYVEVFDEPRPDHAEVWRHVLTLRKRGELPKLGAAKSRPPVIDDIDRARLRDLLGEHIGRRDRLPYTKAFDQLCNAFNIGRRKPFTPHQVWRLVATLAK